MIDYKQANALGQEALRLWGDGRLDEAAEKYSQAISLVEAAPGSAYFHGALAGILKELGRNEEATTHYEKALQIELATAGSEADSSVKAARYFLATHLTAQGKAAEALEVLEPSVAAVPDDWLVVSAQALALLALGRHAEARVAAELAVANADSETKKAELAEHLQAALATSNG